MGREAPRSFHEHETERAVIHCLAADPPVGEATALVGRPCSRPGMRAERLPVRSTRTSRQLAAKTSRSSWATARSSPEGAAARLSCSSRPMSTVTPSPAAMGRAQDSEYAPHRRGTLPSGRERSDAQGAPCARSPRRGRGPGCQEPSGARACLIASRAGRHKSRESSSALPAAPIRTGPPLLTQRLSARPSGSNTIASQEVVPMSTPSSGSIAVSRAVAARGP